MTEREEALLADPEALEALRRGIQQAKDGDYVVLDLEDED